MTEVTKETEVEVKNDLNKEFVTKRLDDHKKTLAKLDENIKKLTEQRDQIQNSLQQQVAARIELVGAAKQLQELLNGTGEQKKD